MRHFIIDGNNLIGKMPSVKSKDKNAEREKLAFILERYFSNRKVKVSLHFDGHKKLPIKVTGIKILYSENQTADDLIKNEIERTTNRKNIIFVSSDNNLKEFARVCSCEVKSSEDFGKDITSSQNNDEEANIIDSIKNIDEFKKLFGVD
ncbi:MAG TPA: NYN domain-containing protein [Ignavibacteriaceae bacterium]|nr:NYN domain-containing protein [Ignavibacteriaceae bacterium]